MNPTWRPDIDPGIGPSVGRVHGRRHATMWEVLIKNAVLDAIFAGDLDTLFRRQKRPTVRSGGTLRTRRGMLDIVVVEAIDDGDITDADARRAGFESPADVRADLADRVDGTLYRVRVRPGGEDPRLALRDADRLSDDELADVRRRLDSMDARAAAPWTRTYLTLIAERPHTRAPDLAASLGVETAPFKANVRKLKALGLTISHNPGYELSPRGAAVVARLESSQA